MKTPAERLIHKSILDRCAVEKIAKDIANRVANNAITKYKNNQFTKASKLVDEAVTEAKKLQRKKGKR